jgi:antitoxin VapB
MSIAKVFAHGGSQAVRLPREFRFDVPQVWVRRVGADVVLSPHPPSDLRALIEALDAFEPGTRLAREQDTEQRRSAIAPGA